MQQKLCKINGNKKQQQKNNCDRKNYGVLLSNLFYLATIEIFIGIDILFDPVPLR